MNLAIPAGSRWRNLYLLRLCLLLGGSSSGAASGVPGASELFYCGNFGILVLTEASKTIVGPLLRKMIKITMMRGAQSAGVVTYQCVDSSSQTNRVGKRFRVVNGKRTVLTDLLLAKCRALLQASAIHAPQVSHTQSGVSPEGALAGAGVPRLYLANPVAPTDKCEIKQGGATSCARLLAEIAALEGLLLGYRR